MKKAFKIVLITGLLLLGVNFLFQRFFFKSHLNEPPEITEIKLDEFKWRASKAFFYSYDKQLYHSSAGELVTDSQPIRSGKPQKLYASPNGQYAIILEDEELFLIDKKGNLIFSIDNCTGFYRVASSRKSQRFLSTDIQWLSNSKGFLISQDRIWDKNYSDKNKTSIYQYRVDTNQLAPLIHLEEECKGDFYLSSDGQHLYYEFATKEGDLAFKKISILKSEIISTHFKGDSLKLSGINSDDLFINYNDFKSAFQSNSYDRKKIVVESWGRLYFDNSDTTVQLIRGKQGKNAFNGNRYGFSWNGYFLPGNRYFTSIIRSKDVNGTLIVDTETFQTMLLDGEYEFYFNINNSDCPEFEFRYSIVPRVRFATSVSLDIYKRFKSSTLNK